MANINTEQLIFDRESNEYYGTFSEEKSPSEAVVEILASIKGCDPLEIGPLAESVDTDSLNKLVRSTDDESFQISFDVDGFTTHVRGDRSVVVDTA